MPSLKERSVSHNDQRTRITLLSFASEVDRATNFATKVDLSNCAVSCRGERGDCRSFYEFLLRNLRPPPRREALTPSSGDLPRVTPLVMCDGVPEGAMLSTPRTTQTEGTAIGARGIAPAPTLGFSNTLGRALRFSARTSPVRSSITISKLIFCPSFKSVIPARSTAGNVDVDVKIHRHLA